MAGNLFVRTLGDGLRWRSWDDDALSEARERDLPLLVVAGSAVDHWSAVLAAGLAGDGDLRSLIDDAFVPVVAEPLEDPALCARIQETLAITADGAGWPACAVATPEGGFFGAVPWRPIRDRDGQIGLARILVEVATTWAERPEDCRADAERLRGVLVEAQAAQGEGRLPADDLLLDNAEAALIAAADPLEGGFGPPPRGLGLAALRFLAQRVRRDDAPLLVTGTLERACAALVQGAAHDQLGGGVHRGCADGSWRRPFFEQRLIDQAWTAQALIEAAEALARPALRVVAERILRWSRDHLLIDGDWRAGRHADAPDATGHPREGAYHTWTIERIAAITGEEAADLLAHRFALADAPGVDGGLPLAVRQPVEAGSEARLAAALQRLAVARGERLPPPLDDRRDPMAEGVLLAAFAAWRDAGGDDGSLLATATTLAARLAGEEAPVVAADAWALGLIAWDADRFRVQIAALATLGASRGATDGRLVLGLLTRLDPPVLAGPDDERGPSVAAVRAELLVRMGDQDGARRLITAHAGLLRRHPAAGAGLLRILAGLHG